MKQHLIFSETLTMLLNESRTTDRMLADAIGCSARYIGLLRTGQRIHPSADIIHRMMAFFSRNPEPLRPFLPQLSPFASVLDRMIRERGYTDEYIAAQVGCTPRYVRQLRTGQFRRPSRTIVSALALLFKEDVDSLVALIELPYDDTTNTIP